MISDAEINTFRKNRGKLINKWLESAEMSQKTLDFFEISSKWRFKVIPKFNRDEPYASDMDVKHKRVGRIEFSIEDTKLKLNLYKNLNDNELYTYTTDISSNYGTYSRGRFTRVFNKNLDYYLDFNASFSPACAHLGELTSCPISGDREIPIRIEAGERHKS